MSQQPVTLNETILSPDKGWGIDVKELWRFRELLFFLTWRDVKVRYKQTALGVLWALIQPVMMMVVFTVVFGRMARVPTGDVPYPIFVYAGLLPWTFFSTAITSCANSVVKSERLITKVYFPRIAIPIASVGAALVDLGIAFSVLAALMWWYGIVPGLTILWLPALVLLTLFAAMGIGVTLAALNVSYRDFRYIVPYLVQLWLFATPAVYMETAAPPAAQADAASVATATPAEQAAGNSPPDAASTTGQLPSSIRTIMQLNPLTGVIGAFRAVILDQPIPLRGLAISAVEIVVLFAIGVLYFRRVEESFADIV